MAQDPQTHGDMDVGRNSAQVFGHLLQGLIRDHWTGMIAVNTLDWKKKIYLHHGRFVSVSSNLLDDRLGDVLYRRGVIDLDQFVNCAVKVEPGQRFGQLLVKEKILSNCGLWDALKLQIISVVKSLFLHERISYLIQDGVEPPTDNFTVVNDSYELVDIFKAYNQLFLSFTRSLDDKSFLTVSSSNCETRCCNHFYGEMITLIEKNKYVKELIEVSKVDETYTLAAVMDLLMANACTLNFDFSARELPAPARIKKAVDVYHRVIEQVVAGLKKHKLETMIDEICEFSRTLSHHELAVLVVDKGGEISSNSLLRIADHCALDNSQIEKYVDKIEAITRFALQVVSDMLPAGEAQLVADNYRRLSVDRLAS